MAMTVAPLRLGPQGNSGHCRGVSPRGRQVAPGHESAHGRGHREVESSISMAFLLCLSQSSRRGEVRQERGRTLVRSLDRILEKGSRPMGSGAKVTRSRSATPSAEAAAAATSASASTSTLHAWKSESSETPGRTGIACRWMSSSWIRRTAHARVSGSWMRWQSTVIASHLAADRLRYFIKRSRDGQEW